MYRMPFSQWWSDGPGNCGATCNAFPYQRTGHIPRELGQLRCNSMAQQRQRDSDCAGQAVPIVCPVHYSRGV